MNNITNNNVKIEANFPLELRSVASDNNPLTFHLTINAILEKNCLSNDAEKKQDELLTNITNAQELVGSGIYRYPKNTIHFSIIDFPDLSSSVVDEERFCEEREKHIDLITKIIKGFENKKINKNEIYFSYIYTGEGRDFPESLAIQAYPSREFLTFFNELRKKFEEKEILESAKIKCYPSDYPFDNPPDDPTYPCRFPVNLVRFFRELKKEELEIFKKNVKELNEKSKKQCLFGGTDKLKRISFVLSDKWLSNEKRDKKHELPYSEYPELSYIEIR